MEEVLVEWRFEAGRPPAGREVDRLGFLPCLIGCRLHVFHQYRNFWLRSTGSRRCARSGCTHWLSACPGCVCTASWRSVCPACICTASWRSACPGCMYCFVEECVSWMYVLVCGGVRVLDGVARAAAAAAAGHLAKRDAQSSGPVLAREGQRGSIGLHVMKACCNGVCNALTTSSCTLAGLRRAYSRLLGFYDNLLGWGMYALSHLIFMHAFRTKGVTGPESAIAAAGHNVLYCTHMRTCLLSHTHARTHREDLGQGGLRLLLGVTQSIAPDSPYFTEACAGVAAMACLHEHSRSEVVRAVRNMLLNAKSECAGICCTEAVLG
eukprot:1148208-Pelagomonas_calceolata.AAC.9